MSEITTTAVAITRIRSRRGSRVPLAEDSGMDSAAANGTTPLMPAHDTTAGTGHDRRREPARRWMTADSGNTHAIRVTISVPAGSVTRGRTRMTPARSRPRACKAAEIQPAEIQDVPAAPGLLIVAAGGDYLITAHRPARLCGTVGMDWLTAGSREGRNACPMAIGILAAVLGL